MRRGRSRTGWMIAALSVACVAIVACGGNLFPPDVHDRACAPGDYRYCDCTPPAKPGYQRCDDDGSGYGACDCSGKIPAGAGVLVEAGAADATSDSGRAGFLDPCINDTDCDLGLRCFPYNAYGPHCSKSCSKDTDCPAPSPGCSGMGVCKLH